ncbi:MAG: hypothetical protein JO225_14715 [Candidatus Eremiobacteraeota bacterium]|nr:hypothetical protein [Candidatus Eremiobacteraeota bacterium]MBV8645157.1 hypothetical protein [Candidatus Eremiobacteraeota bacterium]
MRRIVLSLAALGAIALSACSGGGSVLSFSNSSTPDRTLVEVVGTTNIARVLPGNSLPLSAVGARGPANGYVGGNSFTWSAALVTSGQYPINTGGVMKACSAVTITQSGTVVNYTTDFTQYLTIDPTNTANVIFTPPTSIPIPVGATQLTLPGTNPYCVVVSATPVGGSQANTGSITVAVVNPAGPEN